MAEITAAMVKELRDATGAGMMDCKRRPGRGGRRHGARQGDPPREGPRERREAGRPQRRPGRHRLLRALQQDRGRRWSRSTARRTSSRTPTSSSSSRRTSRCTSRAPRPRAGSRATTSRRRCSTRSGGSPRRRRKEAGKPDNVVEKIVEGKLEAFLKDNVLLDQPFVKDDAKTIQQYLDEVGAKTGEKVVVRRFVRFQLGEDGESKLRPTRAAGQRGRNGPERMARRRRRRPEPTTGSC